MHGRITGPIRRPGWERRHPRSRAIHHSIRAGDPRPKSCESHGFEAPWLPGPIVRRRTGSTLGVGSQKSKAITHPNCQGRTAETGFFLTVFAATFFAVPGGFPPTLRLTDFFAATFLEVRRDSLPAGHSLGGLFCRLHLLRLGFTSGCTLPSLGHPSSPSPSQIPPVHYAISVLTESQHFAFTDHFPRATTGDAFDGITLNSNGSSFGSKRPDCASRAATRTSAVLVSAHLKTVLALNHHMNYYTNIEQTRCEQFFCSKRNS